MKLIGVDVGGTFTDIVCTDTETRHTIIHKSPTTPDDPSHGVITNSVRLNFCTVVELSDASGQYARSIQLPWPIH